MKRPLKRVLVNILVFKNLVKTKSIEINQLFNNPLPQLALINFEVARQS